MKTEQIAVRRVSFHPAEATGSQGDEAVNVERCVKIPGMRDALGRTLKGPDSDTDWDAHDVCRVVRIPLQIVRARVSSYKF
jgi:hypothetical protein